MTSLSPEGGGSYCTRLAPTTAQTRTRNSSRNYNMCQVGDMWFTPSGTPPPADSPPRKTHGMLELIYPPRTMARNLGQCVALRAEFEGTAGILPLVLHEKYYTLPVYAESHRWRRGRPSV